MTDPIQLLEYDLGTNVASYDERDAILYALAVGARATDLDLVFERDLRVLPTFGLTLGLWAPDTLARLGAFDVGQALHGTQRLVVHAPLPPSGRVETRARVAGVWDKESAAVFDVEVGCEYFTATYGIFARGAGGFGGERGPAWPSDPVRRSAVRQDCTVATFEEQAALYRLTGDRHLIHIDPRAARAIGAERPILHGLCTLAASLQGVADARGVHPADLAEVRARFAAPVLPGQVLRVRAADSGDFTVAVGDTDVLVGAAAQFG